LPIGIDAFRKNEKENGPHVATRPAGGGGGGPWAGKVPLEKQKIREKIPRRTRSSSSGRKKTKNLKIT